MFFVFLIVFCFYLFCGFFLVFFFSFFSLEQHLTAKKWEGRWGTGGGVPYVYIYVYIHIHIFLKKMYMYPYAWLCAVRSVPPSPEESKYVPFGSRALDFTAHTYFDFEFHGRTSMLHIQVRLKLSECMLKFCEY